MQHNPFVQAAHINHAYLAHNLCIAAFHEKKQIGKDPDTQDAHNDQAAPQKAGGFVFFCCLTQKNSSHFI